MTNTEIIRVIKDSLFCPYLARLLLKVHVKVKKKEQKLLENEKLLKVARNRKSCRATCGQSPTIGMAEYPKTRNDNGMAESPKILNTTIKGG